MIQFEIDISWDSLDSLESAEPEHALLYDDNPKTLKRRWQAARKAMSRASCLVKPFAFIRGFMRGPDPILAYWELGRDGEYHTLYVALSDVEISYD